MEPATIGPKAGPRWGTRSSVESIILPEARRPIGFSAFIGLWRLQRLDSITISGCFLEFKCFGGLFHAQFEVFDEGEALGDGEKGDFLVAFEGRRDVVGFGDGDEVHVDWFDDGLGGDVVLFVVIGLDAAAAIGFIEGAAHGIGEAVGVEEGAAVEVAGGTADGLDEGAGGAEEAFLVSVEDGDEGDFGEVEALAEEVDADEDVDITAAEVAEYFDALEGFDFGVHVCAFYP